MSSTKDFNNLASVVEALWTLRWEEILIWDLRKKVWLEIWEIIDLLKLLESSKIISFLWDIDETGKVILSDSYLDAYNLRLHADTITTKEEVISRRLERWFMDFSMYSLSKLQEHFSSLLSDICEDGGEGVEISFIDKTKFEGDIALRVTSLLQSQKSRGVNYVKDDIPRIVEKLTESPYIDSFEVKGIYVNIKLSNVFFSEALLWVFDIDKELYWENDSHKWESVVVDYSSPNTAKHLHAWHIRSTIIWHVLSNLYEANGYVSHRVNHINDWGGFGALLEGLERWENLIWKKENKNDMLFEIYSAFRKWEKAASDEDSFNSLSQEDIEYLKSFYGEFITFHDFQGLFTIFMDWATKKFHDLENGDKNEVLIWDKIVGWSMEDFQKFYDVLWVQQDYVIGESFYANMWRKLVYDAMNEGTILHYTQQEADKDIEILQWKFETEEISKWALENALWEIQRDIWAYVVRLSESERYVVLKWDESTIYATRDLAAIRYRTEVFQPSRIIYEVGQEQAEHFDKLFRSSEQMWVEGVDFTHVYHWFYVNAATGKKLSSREGASNVHSLIKDSVAYFKSKYDSDNRWLSEEEIDDIAQKLWVGSIIFNDLVKDKKLDVRVFTDTQDMCQEFEESWGAYVAYIVCRAQKVLDDASWDGNIIGSDIYSEKEKEILLKIADYPRIVKLAWDKDDPSKITEYVLQLSRAFSSYYQDRDERIFETGSYEIKEWMKYKLSIYAAMIQVIKNAMHICHIELPHRI